MWAVTFLYFLFFSLSTVDRHIIGFFSVFVWRWNKGGSTAQPTQRSRFRTAVASKAVSLTSPNRLPISLPTATLRSSQRLSASVSWARCEYSLLNNAATCPLLEVRFFLVDFLVAVAPRPGLLSTAFSVAAAAIARCQMTATGLGYL
eukprot:INCI15803.4.p1 GENE.INCI15803.4~~INCI15803.4.p1  ORF type:complete len:147 (-),score=16.77 INCI15803.4:103-543(-)